MPDVRLADRQQRRGEKPTVKTYELSRRESARLQDDQATLAEEIVARIYDLPHHDADPFDARRDTGAVLEAKSTVTRYSNGTRGRFRLWKPQHSRMTRKDREDTARYGFVLFDVSERPVVARLLLKQPATIGRLIAGRGGFNRSGHQKGKQIKLPYSALF